VRRMGRALAKPIDLVGNDDGFRCAQIELALRSTHPT